MRQTRNLFKGNLTGVRIPPSPFLDKDSRLLPRIAGLTVNQEQMKSIRVLCEETLTLGLDSRSNVLTF